MKREVLRFFLKGQETGVWLEKVIEISILSNPPIRIPNYPPRVSGVINLRGEPIMLIDFGAENRNKNAPPLFVVLHTEKEKCGLLVDGVLDVVSVSGEPVRTATTMSSCQSYIYGFFPSDSSSGKVLPMFDVDNLEKIILSGKL